MASSLVRLLASVRMDSRSWRRRLSPAASSGMPYIKHTHINVQGSCTQHFHLRINQGTLAHPQSQHASMHFKNTANTRTPSPTLLGRAASGGALARSRRVALAARQSPGARGGGGLSPDVAARPLDRTRARESDQSHADRRPRGVS